MSQRINMCVSATPTPYPINLSDKDAVKQFRQDNPYLFSNTIPAGTPFMLRDGQGQNDKSWQELRPDLVCAFNQMQSLPADSKRNIAHLNETYGTDMLEAMAEFHHQEIEPLVRSEAIGAVGAAATAIESRLSEFGKAAFKYQQSLEAVRAGSLAKKPRMQIQRLEQIANRLHQDFSTKYSAEMSKYFDRVKARRGTVLSSAKRGIGLAKGGKTFAPIQFTNTMSFQNIKNFELGANVLGKGLIMIDAGRRIGEVHVDYLQGKDWQRRAAVEATGFGAGTAAGLFVDGAVVKASLGIALLATPVGWVIIIGSALALGYLAAKGGDYIGKGTAGIIYDTSSQISRH